MALFGSIGIGPVRVGASTRGRRRSNSGGIGGGAGFLVIFAIIVFAKIWYVFVGLALFTLFLWGIMCAVEKFEVPNLGAKRNMRRADEAREEAEIAYRAERQHTAIMEGRTLYGTHGEFPPADLGATS